MKLALPGLYNVYNATRRRPLALTLGATLDEIVAGLDGFSAAFGRFERIAVGDKRPADAADQEPGRRERGRAHARRRPPPRLAVIALNDEIADGRDVSWIWDVDFEPLVAGLDRLVVSGTRAAELALRFAYGGLARDRIEVVPTSRRRSTAASSSRRRRRAGRAPDLHRDARAAQDRRRPRARHRTSGRARLRIRVGHLYPDYLNIYADRGNIAVLAERAAARGHELDVRSIGIGEPVPAGIDLFYIGGGQDREQALVAPDLAEKTAALREAAEAGAAFLAVCGGYQLLGRFYRDVPGPSSPASACCRCTRLPASGG